MNKHFRVNQVFQTFLMIGILIHFSQSALAHTLFDIPRLPELKKVTNHITIGHGCQGNTVIGTSVVFPDGQDSIITINDNAHSGTLDEFVSNWGGYFSYFKTALCLQNKMLSKMETVIPLVFGLVVDVVWPRI